MKRSLSWIASLFSEKATLVFDRDKLAEILPHRDRWRLLDSVRFVDGKAIGEFVLTTDICAGHVIAGVLMAPGCIWYDAAAQLLGVIVHRDPEVLSHLGPDKTLGALNYGAAAFRKPFHPGEKVVVETTTEVDYDDRHGFFRVTGGMFFFRLDGEERVRVRVESVTLTPVSRKDME